MAETILTPPPRLDSVTAPDFETAALAAVQPADGVVMDFEAVAFVSSAGLRAVLVVAKRLRASGGRLALCGLSPAVAEVFAISGFSAIMDIHPSRNEALAALRG